MKNLLILNALMLISINMFAMHKLLTPEEIEALQQEIQNIRSEQREKVQQALKNEKNERPNSDQRNKDN